MYQLANQPAFDPLLLLLASLATSNPQSQRTVTENQRLNHSIPTDGTTPLTNDTTPLTDNITPLIVNTAIRAKSALYAVNLDISLQTIRRKKRTKEYVNTSPILRAATAILRITMQVKKIRELLTFTSI